GEQAEALALAHCRQGVEYANAERQRFRDTGTLHRGWRGVVERDEAVAEKRALAVDGAAEAVDDAAEKAGAGGHEDGAAAGPRRRSRVDAHHLSQWHAAHAGSRGRDHFGLDTGVLPDRDELSDGAVETTQLHPEPNNGRDDADALGKRCGDCGPELLGVGTPGRRHIVSPSSVALARARAVWMRASR